MKSQSLLCVDLCRWQRKGDKAEEGIPGMNIKIFKGRCGYPDLENPNPNNDGSVAYHRRKPRAVFLTREFAFIRPY